MKVHLWDLDVCCLLLNNVNPEKTVSYQGSNEYKSCCKIQKLSP